MADETIKDRIYIGTILLEKNRWANPKTPTYAVSEWLDRFDEAGFDGMELWEYHATLCAQEELNALEEKATPVAVYNPYCDFDDASAGDRQSAVEMVQRLGAKGVKYNVGKEPGLRGQYLKNLATWREALPGGCRMLCECHPGTILEEPADAASFFDELGRDKTEIIVHGLRPDLDQLKAWFDAFGPAITHVHLQLSNEAGRREMLRNQPDHVRDAMQVMRAGGFERSFTLEFTQGTGEPDETIEGLWEAALSDLKFLKEFL
ncbi:MAG: hypothetical protein QGI83_22950 [Candidatus Latescibacteria bacterium]|jgi:sugar phosphate isomerase/epimerase|nr:hypothetical protein [Candidatus Latescibacterota bacterium]